MSDWLAPERPEHVLHAPVPKEKSKNFRSRPGWRWKILSEDQGAVKGVYLKGLFAQSRLFNREMDCPVWFYREFDCPVRWSLATPSALESQSRAEQGSVVANPICKCRRHKAGHLQVRVAVGRRSACVLKEAPLNKGPLGFPQRNSGFGGGGENLILQNPPDKGYVIRGLQKGSAARGHAKKRRKSWKGVRSNLGSFRQFGRRALNVKVGFTWFIKQQQEEIKKKTKNKPTKPKANIRKKGLRKQEQKKLLKCAKI